MRNRRSTFFSSASTWRGFIGRLDSLVKRIFNLPPKVAVPVRVARTNAPRR